MFPHEFSSGELISCLRAVFDDRFSATATLATAGVSPPTVDPSAAQQWPIKNQDVKVSKTPAARLKRSSFT